MYLQKTFGRQKLDCHFDEEVFNFTLFTAHARTDTRIHLEPWNPGTLELMKAHI